MKNQPEKILVLNPSKKLCKNLLSDGVILEYKRCDELDVNHQLGAPDLEIRFVYKKILWLLLAECKTSTGKIRLSQKNYRDKYKGIKNVIYLLVYKPSDISNCINSVTGYRDKKEKEVDRIMRNIKL